MTTPLEVKLQSAFTDYALEQLRVRFLFAASETREISVGAKVAAQMAFETEIGTVLTKLASVSPSVRVEVITTRRRFLDVDNDMRTNRFLIEPALASLTGLLVPAPYVNLLRRHLAADYPRYRICAVAATLCLAAALS